MNRIYTSTDGVTWIPAGVPTGETLRAIAFGANRYVAVGDHDTVLVSSDAASWTRQGATGVGEPRGLVHGFGRFVAVGSTGACASIDGVTWQTSLAGTNLAAIGLAQGRFHAVSDHGERWVSTNGIAWELAGVDPVRIHAITETDAGIIAVGGEGKAWIGTSGGGSSWTQVTIEPDSQAEELRSVAIGADRVVAVGGRWSILTSSARGAWKTTLLAGPESRSRVVFAGGRFVAAGNPGVWVSTNGVVWDRRSVDGSQPTFGLASSGDLVVAAVGAGLSVSTNGMVWESRFQSSATYLSDVVRGDDRWVAIGNSRVLAGNFVRMYAVVSADGRNWQESTLDEGFRREMIFRLTYGGGVFLATGDEGVWRRSTDGVHWTRPSPTGITGRIEGLTYVEGRFAAYNSAHTVFVSEDGLTWVEPPATPGAAFHPVTQLPQGYVSFSIAGEVLFSTDRRTWSVTPIGILKGALVGTAYGNGAFVGLEVPWVGAGEARLVQSGGLERLPVAIPAAGATDDGRARLVATAPPGREVALEVSSELPRWSVLKRATNVTGTVVFTDGRQAPGESRFYRVSIPAE